MEFTAHIPDLDGVGGRVTLHCQGWGSAPYARQDNPGLTDVTWDTPRETPEDPEEAIAEHQRRNAVVEAAAVQFIDAAGNLAFVYDAAADDHLRIYGLSRTPSELVARYLANRPPTEFDWGLLTLQKTVSLGVSDLGDIPLMIYDEDGSAVCRRQFAFSYATDTNGATELTVTETPGWARNDGAWVDGPARSEVYRGARYNAWRDSARKRIFEALKTWLPLALVALEEAADVPTGEALSGGWLAANHAGPWSLYMETGRKEMIAASLNADATTWLSAEVPDGLIPGLEPGSTVLELIVGTLR